MRARGSKGCTGMRAVMSRCMMCAVVLMMSAVFTNAAALEVGWECPGMNTCGYDQVGDPSGIVNEGATDAIMDFDVVGLPFGYNQPSLITMTDRGTIIVMYRTSGPPGGGEGGAAYMYCSRKPADSSWSEPIQIHHDSLITECPGIFHIPGSDTTLAWYYSDAYYTTQYQIQKQLLAAGQTRVKVSTDDGVTWSEEIEMPAIDRDNHVISDSAYKWFGHNGHHWAYPQRNPFEMLPDGSLGGFAGIAGNYEGNWGQHFTRSLYLKIPRNNLFHTNPDGDPWVAVPVGEEDEWGNDASGHNGDLLICDPRAQKLAMVSRFNSASFSQDGGSTWDYDHEGHYDFGDFLNGEGDIGKNQGGALSMDWWDTTSVLNGWHIRAGANHDIWRNHWEIWATNVSTDSMTYYHTWQNPLNLAKNYGRVSPSSGSDIVNGGIEDG